MDSKDKYAIIRSVTTYTPGDERSRQCPGHGYPESWDTHAEFTACVNREEWEKEIERLANPRYGSPEKFTAIIYREVEVTKSVSIQIQ